VVALSKFNGSAAEFVEKYSYSAFGETTVTLNGNTGNPYRFTGREYEPETGLYYYRARFYNSTIGRFLQTDPIGYSDSMNLYQYCGNNPINFVDPMGLCKDNAWYKQSWEAVGAFGIGFLERVYDTEVALLHPIDTAKSVWGSMYDMGERFNQTMYDIGANPGMLSDMARDIRDLGGQIAFEELDNATRDPYAWGNSWGKATASAEMSLAAAEITGGAVAAYRAGTEISIGKNLRIAPFGNRTGHPTGRYPHYHRRAINSKTGETIEGGSMKRHRPWDKRTTDQSIKDRF